MVRTLVASLFSLVVAGGQAFAEEVTFKAQDGTALKADLEAVKDSTKGVVLVHMIGRSGQDWRFLADKLNTAGFSTLSVDLRGHGANVPEGAPKPELTDADYIAMSQDVSAAVAFLRSKGVTEISLIGASLGANLALNVASKDPEVRTVVLLSPGMVFKGVDASEALAAYGERPVLIVVSEEDKYSARSGLVLDAQAKGYHKLEVYQGAGHGTKMLNKAPSLEPLVLSWINGSDRLGGDDDPARRTTGLSTGDTTDIETKGKRLGEK